MSKYDHIAIIFNPKSTGDAPAMAKQLSNDIDRRASKIGTKSTLSPTKNAGHAAIIAKEICYEYKRPLIISVSGDGGYNEVINGVMQAKSKQRDAMPTVAVVAAGNANDHKRMTRGDTPLIELIEKSSPKKLDVLQLRTKDGSLQRYAHSYIGLGISPEVGYELNKQQKNPIAEALILMKTFWAHEPISIQYDGKLHILDSLLFANISEMAKVLKLEPKTDVSNGEFRVISFKHNGKLKLLLRVLKAVFAHVTSYKKTSSFTFSTTQQTLVQFDGEIETIDKNKTCTVTSLKEALDSLY